MQGRPASGYLVPVSSTNSVDTHSDRTRRDTESRDRSKSIELEENLKWLLRDKNIIIPKSQIQLSSIIGQGEFGVVYKGYVDINQQKILVALKTLKVLYSEREKEKMLEEMCKMVSLVHPNVMTIIGVCLDGEVPLLIMPFMAKGSVLMYVRDMRETPPYEEKTLRIKFLGITTQVAKGMEYLADCRLVHRDLAARNCMIDWQDAIKVGDFGLSEDVYNTGYFNLSPNETKAKEERLPIRWMAPESIESGQYNVKTDVWSFGVTCWEIFTFGRVPYAGVRAMGLLNLLKSGERLEIPDNNVCSNQIYDVMAMCWSIESKDRPKFVDLVESFDELLEAESDYLALQ